MRARGGRPLHLSQTALKGSAAAVIRATRDVFFSPQMEISRLIPVIDADDGNVVLSISNTPYIGIQVLFHSLVLCSPRYVMLNLVLGIYVRLLQS